MNELGWILGIAGALAGAVLLWMLAAQGTKKKAAAVRKTLMASCPEARLTEHGALETMVETDKAVFLVKAIVFHPDHELIVTNKTYWCVNDKPSQWRRSSKPILIPGVEEFLAWKPETAKRIVRIGVVTPGCRNITFHVNESDVVVVDPTTDVYGYRLMRLSDLAVFLRKAERK